VHGSARIYDVRMAQFVLKIEKLSHIIGARGSQDLRSPSPIMAPVTTEYTIDRETVWKRTLGSDMTSSREEKLIHWTGLGKNAKKVSVRA